MKNWKRSRIIKILLGLLLVPGLFLDVLAGSYMSVGHEYVSVETEQDREFFLSREQTCALLDGYIRLLEEYMQIGELITKDGDIDYDKEILYSLTSDRKYTIKELLRQSSSEGAATEMLQDFMNDFTQHCEAGESYPWKINPIISSDTRVILSEGDIFVFDSPNVKTRTEKTIQDMQKRLPNMVPLTTNDKTFLEDTQDRLLVDMGKTLDWEYRFRARSRYEEYLITYFSDYAACYFLESLLEPEQGGGSRRLQEIYEEYKDSAGKKALSQAKFADKIQKEYQRRSEQLTEKDIPWKVHLIPRTLNEAKKYVTFLVETYQQLTYLFAQTNFFYAYENANGLLLTNQRDTWDALSQQISSAGEELAGQYAYASYTSRTKISSTNLKTNTLPMSGNIVEKLQVMGESFRAGSYQIVVGIDLDGVWNRTRQDEFVEQYQDFLLKRDMYEQGKVYGAVGLFLTCLLLLLLLIRTGTPVGAEISALYACDKVWLEIQLLAVWLVIQVMLWLTRLCHGYSDRMLLLLYSGAMTVFLCILLLLVFSIVKRMKLGQTGQYCILALFIRDVLIGKLSLQEFARKLYRRFSLAAPGKKMWFWLLFEGAMAFYLLFSAWYIYNSRKVTVRSYFHSLYGWTAVGWVLLFGIFLLFWQRKQMQNEMAQHNIILALKQILQGDFGYVLPEQESADVLSGELIRIVNQIGGALESMVEENVRNERMKTELIANVSHDIKTPLTSIINYVDLLKSGGTDAEEAGRYLQILEQKSLRLKVLMEDLIEASKASSGAIELHINSIDFRELLCQAGGEFAERFAKENLEIVTDLPEHPVYFQGDGRRVFRILENLYGNVAKYAMQNTRVYVTLVEEEEQVRFTMKNISSQKLNITAEELTERFVRGDHARTTEGSGLGLSIAKSLTELMGGEFEIMVDGDLFCSEIRFPSSAQDHS